MVHPLTSINKCNMKNIDIYASKYYEIVRKITMKGEDLFHSNKKTWWLCIRLLPKNTRKK